ncbi:hypothetical protein PPERSA_11394 [Pseudocohnilembus persalinus]|uniref:Uncharacterized protein n=1 Tax=Pseudocohnilembus persalinus TaxID=266149 RepID=A0A0V0QPP7_PSEPJ|nr:hypothetical protein PPERSA_11394 [Pseudocohnilembus persalinus]|eukprot:KRX04270.1 hypothetical protein PPERSA_11394 [Pseudocohnilembus persalinus]
MKKKQNQVLKVILFFICVIYKGNGLNALLQQRLKDVQNNKNGNYKDYSNRDIEFYLNYMPKQKNNSYYKPQLLTNYLFLQKQLTRKYIKIQEMKENYEQMYEQQQKLQIEIENNIIQSDQNKIKDSKDSHNKRKLTNYIKTILISCDQNSYDYQLPAYLENQQNTEKPSNFTHLSLGNRYKWR